jgi:hypothetical protein
MPILEISSLNAQLLKREVIPAAILRRFRPTGTSHTWSPNFSRSVMKITVMLPGNYSNTMLFLFQIERFRLLPYPGTEYLWKHPVRFLPIREPDLNHRFLVPLHLMFRFNLCIWYAIVHCCYWCSSLVAFLIVSWVMTSPNGDSSRRIWSFKILGR